MHCPFLKHFAKKNIRAKFRVLAVCGRGSVQRAARREVGMSERRFQSGESSKRDLTSFRCFLGVSQPCVSDVSLLSFGGVTPSSGSSPHGVTRKAPTPATWRPETVHRGTSWTSGSFRFWVHPPHKPLAGLRPVCFNAWADLESENDRKPVCRRRDSLKTVT